MSAQSSNVAFTKIDVPAGTWMTARMGSRVDTRHSPVGTPFFATVASPIYDANGNVLIPENTKLLGSVVGSTRGHRFLRKGAQLAIGIDAIKLHGMYMPVSARVDNVPRSTTMGLLSHEQARLAPGSTFQVQLQAPVTVAVRRTAKFQPAIGGGPRPIAHRRAQTAPRPAQQQPCVRAPGT